MAFETDQTLSGFLEAREAATELLVDHGARSSRALVGLNEALVMQAVSEILSVDDSFYGGQVLGLLDIGKSAVYPIISKLEDPYDLTTGDKQWAGSGESLGPPRTVHTPTDFGREVFGLFVPNSQSGSQ